MKAQSEITTSDRLHVIQTGIDGGCGNLYLNGIKAEPMTVIWSWGEGWEHVSCSYRKRVPTWEEMCKVKEIFFYPEEVAVQFHPRKSEYVNLHPNCLHLWRKVGQDFETPDRRLV